MFMNKIIITMAAVTGIGFAACAQDKGGNSMQIENKPLVVYFSATYNPQNEALRFSRTKRSLL